MDLSTTYLGLSLKNPLIPAASPISRDLDTAKRLEDSGAAALVMYSLFEEQVRHEGQELDHFLDFGSESYAESLNFLPEPDEFCNLEAQEYIKHLSSLKRSLDIPIIASLNGVSNGGWIRYAQRMEEAGADAIELNIYYAPTEIDLTPQDLERRYFEDLKTVKRSVKIPVSMKLGPFFTSFGNLAKRLSEEGADGLVLFNRFFGPDIDIENLELLHTMKLSSTFENRLPLRWMAILYGNVKASLAASGGIHSALDVLKMVMAGADVTMMASALLRNGATHIATVLNDMQQWMEENDYESIEQMKGSLSCRAVADPSDYGRTNYMRSLQSYL